mgnify:FL=1
MRTFLNPINHHNKNIDNYWLKRLIQDYKCFKSMKRSFDFMCSFAEDLKQPIKELEREMYLNRSLSEEQMVKIYKELNNLIELQSYYYDVALGIYDPKIWD